MGDFLLIVVPSGGKVGFGFVGFVRWGSEYQFIPKSGQNLESDGVKISQEVFVISDFQMAFLLIFCFVELCLTLVYEISLCAAQTWMVPVSTDKRFAFNHKNSVDGVGFALCFPWTRTSEYVHSLFYLIKCSIINSANALLSKRWVLQFPERCVLGWRGDEVRDEIGSGVWVKPISFASPVLRSLEQAVWPLLQNQELIFLELFQFVLWFFYGNSQLFVHWRHVHVSSALFQFIDFGWHGKQDFHQSCGGR